MRINFIYEPKINSIKELQDYWEKKAEMRLFFESLNESMGWKLDTINLPLDNIHIEFE
jgi:hypothetical protein